jgi:site-specific recombinase XerD
MAGEGLDAPPDVTPRDAAERWLSKQAAECTEGTISAYWYRIKKIVDYCEDHGIDRLQDLSAWALDEFDAEFRGRSPAKITLEKEYGTMNDWLEWAEAVGIAQDGLAHVLDPPKTTKEEEVSDERLEPAVATANILEYRDQRVGGDRATRQHTLVELEWWTGARMAALRGLDRRDVDLDQGTLNFVHRPATGTPIKQAHNPERKVGLQEPVVDVLRDYVDDVRVSGVVDEYGREPLLTTNQGRISDTSFRRDSYFGSLPCQASDCPHGREPASCDWYAKRPASKCPSARGPHAIRTGAISNLLNSGWYLDDVADRVNTGPARLKRHYDFPTVDEQFRERRADLVDQLRIDNQPTTYSQTDDDK